MKLFKKRMNELEKVLLDFLNGDGYKKYAALIAKKQQEEYWRLKEKERQQLIKEKYEYLQYRKDNDFELSEEQQKEYEYVSFLVNKKI